MGDEFVVALMVGSAVMMRLNKSTKNEKEREVPRDSNMQ